MLLLLHRADAVAKLVAASGEGRPAPAPAPAQGPTQGSASSGACWHAIAQVPLGPRGHSFSASEDRQASAQKSSWLGGTSKRAPIAGAAHPHSPPCRSPPELACQGWQQDDTAALTSLHLISSGKRSYDRVVPSFPDLRLQAQAALEAAGEGKGRMKRSCYGAFMSFQSQPAPPAAAHFAAWASCAGLQIPPQLSSDTSSAEAITPFGTSSDACHKAIFAHGLAVVEAGMPPEDVRQLENARAFLAKF